MIRLSVAIITLNEEENLGRWLEAVRPLADEIVAVDAGSGDATVAMLQAAGARVEQHPWQGFAHQRNFAASLCRGEWILFLDADEVPEPELINALSRFKASPPTKPDIYAINRRPMFFGRFLRHGGFFPEYRKRLYRPGAASWQGDPVHEDLVGPGPVGRLPGAVSHYSYPTVDHYLRRLPRYSRLAAQKMLAQGRRASPWSGWSHAWWNFFSRYLLRLGFLDGYPGYLAARLESLYTLTKYAQLAELGRRADEGP